MQKIIRDMEYERFKAHLGRKTLYPAQTLLKVWKNGLDDDNKFFSVDHTEPIIHGI